MAEEFNVQVTQDGKVIPTTGSTVKVTMFAQGTDEVNEDGNAVQRFFVVRSDNGFALVPLFGFNKGKVITTHKRIHHMVESLNDNSYIKDWVVEAE